MWKDHQKKKKKKLGTENKFYLSGVFGGMLP